MPKSVYARIAAIWKDDKNEAFDAVQRARLLAWRREPVIVRVEKPTRLDRARAVGYRAKQGYVVARTRVRRGSLRKSRFQRKRKHSKMGVRKITMKKSIQRIAEERVARRYPNLEVLNSYWVAEDGKHKFFEVVLVDPSHPVIQADPKINWICGPAQRNRVMRGLTSAGKKSRGLRWKGKGSEHTRPSARAAVDRGRQWR